MQSNILDDDSSAKSVESNSFYVFFPRLLICMVYIWLLIKQKMYFPQICRSNLYFLAQGTLIHTLTVNFILAT